MTLVQIIEEAKKLAYWVHENTNNTKMPNEKREKIGLAIFQQSLDVGDGILILLEANLPGPDFALGRPLFESYVRGLWLLNHASEEHLKEFLNGKCPKFPVLLKKIGDIAETGGAWIHATADFNLKSFHDLTHGGGEHVIRRVTEYAIKPNYPKEEKIQLVKLQIAVQINITAILLTLLRDEEALKQLYKKATYYRALS